MRNTKRSVMSLFAVGMVIAALNAYGAVEVSEGQIEIPTYAWFDDVNPVFAELEGAIYYPYTKQDHIAKEKSVRLYKTLILENDYLKITCLPELGGRLHSVLDKTTGEEMFHRNDVIKPALIAMRGAWIGGGVEWNVGPQGHTVTIVSPVDALLQKHADGSASLVIGNTEKMFRTRWTVRVTLDPGKAYLDEEIRLYNPTDGTHPYYFWNCTGFPNRAGTRFIYPMTLGTDHNGTSFYSWPLHAGKDLSYLRNYETMSSIFAYDCRFNFFGAYESGADRGIVSYANYHELPGKKAWTWGQDDFALVSQMSLSDAGREGAPYIEVQSGPLLTQSDYGMLGPREEKCWREYWYPVHALGNGFEYATREVAAEVIRAGKGLELRLMSTGVYPGSTVVLRSGERVLLEEAHALSPLEAVSVRLAEAPEGPIGVEVKDSAGAVLLAYMTPLAIPKVEAPDLSMPPARADGRKTAGEAFQEAWLRDSQSCPAEARALYVKTLEEDPGHVAALCALAAIDIEEAQYAAAIEKSTLALKRAADCGQAWYLKGVAQLGVAEWEGAEASAYRCAHALDTYALGYGLAGRVLMRQGRLEEAVAAFAASARRNPEDTRNRDLLLIARYAAGMRDGLGEAVGDALAADPTDFLLRALLARLDQTGLEGYRAALQEACGEPEFTLLENALCFAELGLFAAAAQLLEDLLVGDGGMQASALAHYYRAWLHHLAGAQEGAEAAWRVAASLPVDYVHPARREALDLFAYMTAEHPEDQHARLLYGYVLAHLRRLDEAAAQWGQVAAADPMCSTAWRLLGLVAKQEGKKDVGVQCFRKALDARPEDQLLRRDLAEILAGQGKRGEAINLLAQVSPQSSPRYDVVLNLADYYLAEGRLDECIALLEVARFSNWEGQTRPHDIWEEALLQRAQEAYAAENYEAARDDLLRALTYPEHLEVGAKYELTDAVVRYWLGKTWLALGEGAKAKASFEIGAAQRTKADPKLPFIGISEAQDMHVKQCRTALELL